MGEKICYCQGITVTTNDTHQITITWLLSTATCLLSSRALYQRNPPKPSLSGLKHCMCYLPDSSTFVYLLVVPVFRSPVSTVPVLHRLLIPLFPLDPMEKEKDLLRSDKTLLNIAIPCALTWTLHLASLLPHSTVLVQ